MGSYTIRVSEHALDRIRERSGINKRAAQKLAERAYENGIKHSETNGSLHKFICSVTNAKKRKGLEIRIYGDKVFLFSKYTKFNDKLVNSKGNNVIILITILQIPNNLNNRVKGIMNKKKESGGN